MIQETFLPLTLKNMSRGNFKFKKHGTTNQSDKAQQIKTKIL